MDYVISWQHKTILRYFPEYERTKVFHGMDNSFSLTQQVEQIGYRILETSSVRRRVVFTKIHVVQVSLIF